MLSTKDKIKDLLSMWHFSSMKRLLLIKINVADSHLPPSIKLCPK